jgi:hypothetical protein
MSNDIVTGGVSVLLAIIGVAIIALLVSNQAKTSSVISAGGSGFASALSCALSPVTGAQCASAPIIGTSSSTISYG